ncbi:HhH-GPD family protein, partial [Listeria monocytogenes FSL F2-208]
QTPAIIFCDDDLYNFFIVFPSFHLLNVFCFKFRNLDNSISYFCLKCRHAYFFCILSENKSSICIIPNFCIF